MFHRIEHPSSREQGYKISEESVILHVIFDARNNVLVEVNVRINMHTQRLTAKFGKRKFSTFVDLRFYYQLEMCIVRW